MDKEKKNGKKKLIVTMVVSLILLVGITVSYAYIALISQNKDQEIDLNAGNLHLVFKDADAGSINGSLNLGSSITKGFTIENTGNGDAYAKINWDNLVNTYLPQSLTYTLECDMGEGNWTSIDTYRTNVQRSSEPSKKTLADRLLIPDGEKYTYRLKIKLENLESVNQERDLDAVFQTNFSIEEGTRGVISELKSFNNVENKINIIKIVLEDKLIPKENAVASYDLSVKNNKSVMGYLLPSETESTKYTLYVQGNGEIIAPSNSTSLFSFSKVESIEGLEYLNTSKVTNMSNMFYYCQQLTRLDLSNFDTSNVKNMSRMFNECRLLNALDLNNFDTSKVTNMNGMFAYCSKITDLKVNNFDTSKVTDMGNMFYFCQMLTTLDVTNFDISKADINSMFGDCNRLISLDVSNFDVSNMTDLYGIFFGCSSLQELDLSTFDTKNINNITFLFYNCRSLEKLNLSNWNISSINTTLEAFYNVDYSIEITVNNNDIKEWLINTFNFEEENIIVAV